METEAGSLDFYRVANIESLDQSFFPNDFIDISETKKAIVFTTETDNSEHLPEGIEAGLVVYILTIDSQSTYEFDYQYIPDYSNFFRYHNSVGNEVFVSSSLGGIDNCFYWSTLGVNVKGCFELDDREFRISNGQITTGIGSHPIGHIIFNDTILYYGTGFELDPVSIPISTTPLIVNRTNSFQSWLATINGNYSAFGQVSAIRIQDQENIENILYLEESKRSFTQDFSTVPVTISDIELTDTISFRFAASFRDESELLMIQTALKIDIYGDEIDDREVKLVIQNTDGDSSIVPISNYEIIHNFYTNIDEGEATPEQFEGYLNFFFGKKYKGRYYTPGTLLRVNGVIFSNTKFPYIKEDGTVGNVALEFDKVPLFQSSNFVVDALYVSDTRGLVFASGSTIRYLVITEQ